MGLKPGIGSVWSLINRCLFNNLEALIAPKSNAGNQSHPVFILGPPRSGSTLIMQVMANAFNVGYMSNRHCRWFGAPALAERMYRPLVNIPPSEYGSTYGRTSGMHAPAECGQWWYRFFRRHPAYVTLDDVSARKMALFRRSVCSLELATGLPLIFKNLYASLRLEPIAQYLPNALFVVIERDWVENGQSILKGRYDALGDYSQWWSVPPPNVDDLAKLRPVQQVVGQIDSIIALINRDIERLGLRDQTFRIYYEDFCKDVQGALDSFQRFMVSHGIALERRFDVPACFSIDDSRKIPNPMYEELQAEVSKRKASEIAFRGDT